MSVSQASMKGRLHFQLQNEDAIYENQFPYQIGTDKNHLLFYPEIIPIDRGSAPEPLSDINCYFINSVTGHNGDESPAGDGTESNPYRTLEYTVDQFFGQATRVKNYICILDESTYVEYINIPYWLTGYIYKNLGVSPTIMRLERTIPAGLTDSNTKYVDIVSGDDATGTGVEANPYLTVQAALDSITTVDFLYVAVLVTAENYTTTEVICWTPTATVTQNVLVFPYCISVDGTTFVPGEKLLIQNDTTKHGFAINSVLRSNVIKQQMIVSRNFHTNGYQEVFFAGFGTDSYAIQSTYDFKSANINTYASTSSKNWTGICEYYYNNTWYILICGDDGGTNMRIYYRDKAGTDTGEYQIALTGTAATNRGHYFVSDGNNALMICYEEGYSPEKSYVFLLEQNADCTAPGSWTEIYTGSNYIHAFKIEDSRFLWTQHGIPVINEYINGNLNTYNTPHWYELLFKINGVLHGAWEDTVNKKIVVDVIDLINNTFVTVSEYTPPNEYFELEHIIKYEDKYAYIIVSYGGSYSVFYFNGKNISHTGYLDNLTDIDNVFQVGYESDPYKGLIVFGAGETGPSYKIGAYNIACVTGFGNLKLEGVEIDALSRGDCYSGNSVNFEYCQFINGILGYNNCENTPSNLNKSIFTDCIYPIVIQQYCGDDIKKCIFSGFVNGTGIDYRITANTGNSNIDIVDCTFYNGEIAFREGSRAATLGNESSVTNSLISNISYSCYSECDQPVSIDNCIIYPYALEENTSWDTNTQHSTPVFVDPDDNDYRLQCVELGYESNSPGREDSSTTHAVYGKSYYWQSYSDINEDIGALTVLTPSYRENVFTDIPFQYSPISMNYDIEQVNTAILIAVDGTTYKNDVVLKNKLSFQWSSENVFNLNHIAKIKRLMGTTDPFKIFINSIYDHEITLSTELSWESSLTYDYITNCYAGWLSGTWTISDMTVQTGISDIEPGQYDNLFITIYVPGEPWSGTVTKYEYRISDTDGNGNLTLEDYWGIGDIANGTYEIVVSYMLCLYPVENLSNSQEPFTGFNKTDTTCYNTINNQKISFIEV